MHGHTRRVVEWPGRRRRRRRARRPRDWVGRGVGPKSGRWVSNSLGRGLAPMEKLGPAGRCLGRRGSYEPGAGVLADARGSFSQASRPCREKAGALGLCTSNAAGVASAAGISPFSPMPGAMPGASKRHPIVYAGALGSRLVPLVSTKYAGPGDSSTGVLNGIHASRPWMEYCGAPRMCPDPYGRAPGPSGRGCISKRAASV